MPLYVTMHMPHSTQKLILSLEETSRKQSVPHHFHKSHAPESDLKLSFSWFFDTKDEVGNGIALILTVLLAYFSFTGSRDLWDPHCGNVSTVGPPEPKNL